MEISQTLYVTNRDDWRAWLEKYQAVKSEIWLIYFKKHTGQPSLAYDDAVEEALCFGWIDGIIKRIDDQKYAQRFTPRKPNSNWSELNKARVRRLKEEGRMTETGLAKINAEVLAEKTISRSRSTGKRVEVPKYIRQYLMANKTAWENFNNLAPSYRSQYVQWVTSAKKEETRMRRLAEATELLSKNKKLGMK